MSDKIKDFFGYILILAILMLSLATSYSIASRGKVEIVLYAPQVGNASYTPALATYSSNFGFEWNGTRIEIKK